MRYEDVSHFAIAPPTLDPSKGSLSDWQIQIAPRVGETLNLQPESITQVDGYHKGLKVLIQINQKEGVRITEGVYLADTPSGRMGASMFGSSQSGRMGYSLVHQVIHSNGETQVLFSGTEQQRPTIDVHGTTFNISRGFAERPELSDAQLAILEHEEEAGVFEGDSWVQELGQPQITNHHLMTSTAPGQGINIFKFKLPPGLLEELPHLSEREKRRWMISAEFHRAEGKHRAFEGIKRNIFVINDEVVQQEVWTGPVDLMTYVASARLLMANCNLDHRGTWSRLKDRHVPIQRRDKYPISTLNPQQFDSLIGGQPGWQWTVNGKVDTVPIGAISAHQLSTGYELGFGRRGEATHFDGSVVAMPMAVALPMVEINGQIYVGGRFTNLPHVGENKPFVAISAPIQLSHFSTSDLIPAIESVTGVTDVFGRGIFQPHLKQTIAFNANSAHETEAHLGFSLQVNPDRLLLASPGRYQIVGGDPSYVFIPLKEALDSPIGPTAVVTASIFAGARVLSVK